MKLLITGGAGYIGSHVVLAALDRKFNVTVFDDMSTSNKANINPKAKLVVGSTKSNEDLSKLFENKTFDGVIHLAAFKAAGESNCNPVKYAKNNIMGSLNLLNKCIKHEVKSFIFSSSAAVYGKPKYLPIDESHSLNPINYYGFTKLSFERNLRWYSKTYALKYASLRYFNAAGYDPDKRVIGTELNPQNLIPIIMETALGKRPNVLIFGDRYDTKDGTGVRDYIHVNDLAKAHISAFEYVLNKGEIIEEGTYKLLKADKKSHFSKLISLQQL